MPPGPKRGRPPRRQPTAKVKPPKLKAPKVASAPSTPRKRPIEQYEHDDKLRLNNPPVGLVTPETDNDQGKKTYSYDPHFDPQGAPASSAPSSRSARNTPRSSRSRSSAPGRRRASSRRARR